MNWQEAINESIKGTATRTLDSKNGIKSVIIRYKDGSGYKLVSNNGKLDSFLCRPAQRFEMDGFDDWGPSE